MTKSEKSLLSPDAKKILKKMNQKRIFAFIIMLILLASLPIGLIYKLDFIIYIWAAIFVLVVLYALWVFADMF